VSTLRVGTRGSPLALWQARTVAGRIEEAGGPSCRLVIIKTSGDHLSEAPLSEIGGKRLFVKEIEEALGAGRIDLAVHSAKDLPADLPPGLTLGAVLPREDPRDALVLPLRAGPVVGLEEALAALGRHPRIGTSSVRRVTQLARLMPSAAFSGMRGNLDTRLRKLDDGQTDALVLAVAGMKRLGFTDRISLAFPIATCVPAPGQGTVAVEIRADDDTARSAVAAIDDATTSAALTAERALVEALGGGCQLPLGAVALPRNGHPQGAALDLHAIVVSLDGRQVARAQGTGPLADSPALGRRVAERLAADGATAILDEVRRQQAAPPDRPRT
jgi:hydroxymethylbilane synthase